MGKFGENMQLKVQEKVCSEIIRHAKEELPHEACGYILLKNDVCFEARRMLNLDKSNTHFTFSAEEQFEVLRYANDIGAEIVANYHSHITSEAYPSAEDVKFAFDSNMIYFIVSLLHEKPIIRAYKIHKGKIKEIELHILHV